MAFKSDPAVLKKVIRYESHAIPAPYFSDRAEKDSGIVYLDDLETRKKAYGTCSRCKEPRTGFRWCRSCNAERFRFESKYWTSGNKIIDELILESQLNAVHLTNCIEWVPFDKLKDVTYIAKGGFGKIYKAYWSEGSRLGWDSTRRKWRREPIDVALKSLDKSSNISIDFINEIKSYLQVYSFSSCINRCYGITQDPISKDYMMILNFSEDGSLRNLVANSKVQLSYNQKTEMLWYIAEGLRGIHRAGKVHKDFHSGNILGSARPLIEEWEDWSEDTIIINARVADLGLCRPVDSVEQSGRIYGVLPYVAPEVLRGKQYTQAADIYSFGIVMNEFLSEEYPFGDIPHDYALVKNIFSGIRPKISEHVPKILVDIIKKCWNAEAKDRPTAEELLQILEDKNNEICSQIKEGDEKYKECKSKITSKNTSKIESNDNNKFIQTHPQAIYTSRLLELPQFTSDLEFTLDKFVDQEPNEE